jgi:hypothetical protein
MRKEKSPLPSAAPVLLNLRTALIVVAWWWAGAGSVIFWIFLADYVAWLLAWPERQCDPFVFRKSDFPDQLYDYVPAKRFHFYFGGRHVWKKFKAVGATINSHGFRGRETGSKDEENSLRIMAVGDSFSFGAGVNDGEEFIRLVEKDWNRAGTFPRRIEIINASVGGYNTTQGVAMLRRCQERLRPDMIWLFISLEDTFAWGKIVVKDDGTLFRPGAPFRVRLRRLVRDTSGLAWWLEYAERYRRGDSYIPPLFHPGFSGYQEWKKSVQRYCALTGSPGRSLVFIAPGIWNLGNYPWRACHEQIRREVEDLGHTCIDLLPAVEGQETTRLWVHPLDQHPNARAHGLLAEWISRNPVIRSHISRRIEELSAAHAER